MVSYLFCVESAINEDGLHLRRDRRNSADNVSGKCHGVVKNVGEYTDELDASNLNRPIVDSLPGFFTTERTEQHKFAVEKDRLYVQDPQGKEYKLKIIKQGPKATK